MKKSFLFLMCTVAVFQLGAQEALLYPKVELLKELDLAPQHYYFSADVPSSSLPLTPKRVLRFTPAEFEVVEDSIPTLTVVKGKQAPNLKTAIKQVKISDSYYLLIPGYDRKLPKSDSILCMRLLQIPPMYKSVIVNIQVGEVDEGTVAEDMVIVKRKVIKTAQQVEVIPYENQIGLKSFQEFKKSGSYVLFKDNVVEVEWPKGNWTAWKDSVQPAKPPKLPQQSVSIEKVQRKLKALGYNCPINNVLDQATKDALHNFQKDNNLPIGMFDEETLEKLGVVESSGNE